MVAGIADEEVALDVPGETHGVVETGAAAGAVLMAGFSVFSRNRGEYSEAMEGLEAAVRSAGW